MTEAVIVSTARTPIGRAFKGSLKDVRPDDLSRPGACARPWPRCPALDPADDRRPLLAAAREPSGEHGSNLARVVAVLAGYDHLPGATVNRFCASSRPDHADGLPRHQGRRGRRLPLRRASSASRSTPASPGPAAPTTTRKNPAVRRGRGAHAPPPPRATRRGPTRARTACCPTSTSPWARPPRTSPRSRGISPRSARTSGACRARTAPRRPSPTGSSSREITPVTLADGTVVSKDDGPRAGVTLEAVAGLQPVFRADGTVTAGNCCPLNDGAAAVVVMSDTRPSELGLTPLARDRLAPASRPLAGDHGPRPGRGHPAGPGPRRA